MIGSKLTHTARVQIALGATSCGMLTAFAGLAWYGLSQFGSWGLIAAAVACGLCWLSGIIALGAMLIFRSPEQAVTGLLLGILFRMSLPLAAGLLIQKSHRELVQAGVMGMLIGVYLFGLVLETFFSWWIIESSSGTSTAKAAKAL